jgi:hypothetical protein
LSEFWQDIPDKSFIGMTEYQIHKIQKSKTDWFQDMKFLPEGEVVQLSEDGSPGKRILLVAERRESRVNKGARRAIRQTNLLHFVTRSVTLLRRPSLFGSVVLGMPPRAHHESENRFSACTYSPPNCPSLPLNYGF